MRKITRIREGEIGINTQTHTPFEVSRLLEIAPLLNEVFVKWYEHIHSPFLGFIQNNLRLRQNGKVQHCRRGEISERRVRFRKALKGSKHMTKNAESFQRLKLKNAKTIASLKSLAYICFMFFFFHMHNVSCAILL